ncbi:ERF family protein [Clostridium sporogenes]|uniref:Single-stranded DNA-binding protein n=1 Tax=Clostridium botulinum TaxID=1491 RepID=A0A6M0SVD6_CLOBO|nr:ERF family protein [Clostridium sporogenes]NFA59499.1 single-stranded DNA-binding protein [Clostridium botulinum]NFI74683.1 single-stranded DNA-binding protein [Clostridium sporogenes]NFL71182.1 single-stranded DNA-binding protein [Clostridium sporogenes]NFM26205.1 single-stranded DNA-binding protein [Clostridium sporogenes]NFP62455.1 single-stranded DNA-binding protein [Clostridium sporogenes]
MSVYKKLAQARVKLQNAGLKKSGKNKFANYDYFELCDFLPKINEINADLGICTVVKYDENIATLVIVDVDKPDSSITITSPMKDATLKGCHEIQNLGAVESYQRRYLYMTAYEIAENDMLDATTGSGEPPKNNKVEIENKTHICSKCKANVPEKVAKYSYSKFKKVLCFDCQKGEK